MLFAKKKLEFLRKIGYNKQITQKNMLLLSSQSFPNYGLERFFAFTKKAGYDGVEIVVCDNYDTQNPKYLKDLEKRFKLPIRSFSLPKKNEEKYIEAFQEVVKEFRDVDINLSSPEILSFKYKKWIAKVVPRLSREYGLLFQRKNSPFRLFLGILPSRTENSLFSLREAGNVCLDVSALWESKEEIMRTISFLGKHLRHIYLSNVFKNVPYSLPQNGVLPLESFLTRLAQNKYAGDFTMRISPKRLSSDNEEKLIEELVGARKFFEKYFKKSKKRK